MNCLYIRPDGLEQTKHSYSAGCDFDQSPFKYYLRRVQGWYVLDNRACFAFGKAIEDSIRFFHENGGKKLIETFNTIWNLASNQNLKYTKTEKDWENLARCGNEMLRLYEILQPNLPIPIGANSVFQREYSKEIFPGDEQYGGIDHRGFVDVTAYTEWDHPMLPKVMAGEGLRSSIGDIKTTGKAWYPEPGMCRFHKQMRNYAYLTDIETVWMLFFQKKSTTFSKRKIVTLLEDLDDIDYIPAGTEMFIAAVDEEKERLYLVHDLADIDQMEEIQGRKEDGKLDTKKEAIKRKEEWIVMNANTAPFSCVTCQRVQFDSGIIPKETALQSGIVAGRQIVNIVNSWKMNKWIDTFDITNNYDRQDPYFKAFVLNDEEFRKENFIKIDEPIEEKDPPEEDEDEG